MPRGGIPPEVADEILYLVQDDMKTLLSCCRASKGLCARAQPILYRRLDIFYLSDRITTPFCLNRASGQLLDTLYTRPAIASMCTDLRIWWREKAPGYLLRLRTEPTVEAIRELFDCLPNISRFQLGWAYHQFSLAGTQLERSVVEVLQAWTGWPDLRILIVPRLHDELLRFVIGRPEVVDLRVTTAKAEHALPAGIVPPFRLKRLEVGHQLQNDIFHIGTSTSQETLQRLTVPFNTDLSVELEPFRNLRYLCLEFSSYAEHSLGECHEWLERIKTFMKADSRISTLAFSHARGSPRSNRIRTVRSALPRNLETLILHPWPMRAEDALECIEVGMDQQNLWPSSLKKIVWTPESTDGSWTEEESQLVRDKCLEHAIADVYFPRFPDWCTGDEDY